MTARLQIMLPGTQMGGKTTPGPVQGQAYFPHPRPQHLTPSEKMFWAFYLQAIVLSTDISPSVGGPLPAGPTALTQERMG